MPLRTMNYWDPRSQDDDPSLAILKREDGDVEAEAEAGDPSWDEVGITAGESLGLNRWQAVAAVIGELQSYDNNNLEPEHCHHNIGEGL